MFSTFSGQAKPLEQNVKQIHFLERFLQEPGILMVFQKDMPKTLIDFYSRLSIISL